MQNILKTLDNNYITFENKMIRVIIDIDDKIWFNAKDLINALGYSDYRDVIKNI